MYCALMGDIIDSRKIIEGRRETQEKFNSAIKNINEKYNSNIESEFKITDGDGFYGLLNSPENLLNIILEIRLAIVPNQIRIGIGIGDIGTKILKHESNMIDGRANSLAKEAIDYISQNKNKYQSVYMTTMLKVDRTKYAEMSKTRNNLKRSSKVYEALINSIFCACSIIEKEWNTIHADTITLKLQKYTQRELAESLGISQSAVQQRLASADWYQYEYYTKTLKFGIKELWEEVQYA